MSDVVTAWRGVLEAAKINPRLAGYRPGADPARTCSLCGWHDGSKCALVAGIVSDSGTCDLWKQATQGEPSRPPLHGGK